jgi:hypothetical protein
MLFHAHQQVATETRCKQIDLHDYWAMFVLFMSFSAIARRKNDPWYIMT